MNTDGTAQTFTVVGSGFGTNGGSLVDLKLNSDTCTILTKTSTTATCTMSPTQASGGTNLNVEADINGAPVTGTGILSYKAPTVTSVTPNAIDFEAGVSMTVSGHNFGTFDPNVQSVTVGATTYTSTFLLMPNSHTTFVVTVNPPTITSTDNVVVSSTGQQSTDTSKFIWVDLDVTGVTSNSTETGDTIGVDAGYYGDNTETVTRAVLIDGTACDTTTYSTSTRILCQGVPACSSTGSKSVVVTVGDASSAVSGSVSVYDCGSTSSSSSSVTMGVTYTAVAGTAVFATVLVRFAISVMQVMTQGAGETFLAWMRV